MAGAAEGLPCASSRGVAPTRAKSQATANVNSFPFLSPPNMRRSPTHGLHNAVGGSTVMLALLALLLSGGVPTIATGLTGNVVAEESEVALCGDNERVVDGACEACPAGTMAGRTNPHIWSRADPTGANTECAAVKCEANFKVVSNECTACQSGQTNTAGDDASGCDTHCDGCSPGFYRNPSAGAALAYECIPCPAGYFCTGGPFPTLDICPAGT